jgi:hypothetical protein
MKQYQKYLAFIAISCAATNILFSGCKKDTLTETPLATTAVGENYASLADFFKQNEVQSQTFTIDATKGGTFTGAKGTVFTIPPYALLNSFGQPVNGNVKIEIKEIYDKSDMLLSDKPTALFVNNGPGGIPQEKPLKSGGEFFMRAVVDTGSITLSKNTPIKVVMPAVKIDSMMMPFRQRVVQPFQPFDWEANTQDAIKATAASYIYTLYSFTSSPGKGSWCNSDNQFYFPSNNQVAIVFAPADDISGYETNVFIVLNNVQSMIHVYKNGINFPYNYAPNGEACIMVVTGFKDGKLYSAFVPFTITPNAVIKFSLAPTTGSELRAKIKALN